MVTRVLWVVAAGLWACACSAPALTPAIVAHFSLDLRSGAHEPLSRLQVFPSGDVVLVRDQNIARQGGSRLEQISKVEKIQVNSGTPGKVLQVDRDAQGRALRLHVGFDPKRPKRTLSFGLRRDRAGVEPPENLFRLLPTRGVGIQYGEHMYRLEDSAMWQIHLTYQGIVLKLQEEVEQAPGWSVGGAEAPAPGNSSANGKAGVRAQVNMGAKNP